MNGLIAEFTQGATATAPNMHTGEPPPPHFSRQTIVELDQVLLLTSGAWANTVAAAAMHASVQWLPCTPPLIWLDVGAAGRDETAPGASLAQRLVAAVDDLASQARLAALQQNGCTVRRSDELHCWLVVDVPEDASQNQPGVGQQGNPATGSPAATIAAQSSAGATVLTQVEQIVWQRLRIHAISHVLLLAQPAAQQSVAGWAQQLRTGGAADLLLAGPVTQAHARLTEPTWLAHAASALAGLWWGMLPSYASSPDNNTVRAVGAAVWPSALPAVRHWLTLRSVTALLAALAEPIVTQSEEIPVLSVAQTAQALTAGLPPPLPASSWAGRQPDWALLDDLATLLTGEEARLEESQCSELRQARLQWLDCQLDNWTEWVQRQEAASLMPISGLPAPVQYAAALAACETRVRTSLEYIDQALEEAGQVIETTQRTLALAEQQLRTLCLGFPHYTARSVAGAFLQPWRWPAWLWRYLHDLPRAGQALLTARACRRAAVWHEANWHLLRQFQLALQQDVRRRLADAARVQGCLAAVQEWTLAQTEGLHGEQGAAGDERTMASPPTKDALAPWTDSTLEALWQATAEPVVVASGAAFLHSQPLTTWAAQDPAQLGAGLVAAISAVHPPLADWTTLDCLVLGLERAAQLHGEGMQPWRPTTAEPGAWLEAQWQAAQPLWPQPEAGGLPTAAGWLLLPVANRTDCQEAVGGRAQERIQHWAQTRRTPAAIGACAGNALVLLRWLQLALNDLEEVDNL